MKIIIHRLGGIFGYHPVFEIIPVKKNVKVELAGIYIVKVQGTNLANKKKKTFGEKMSLKMKEMQEKK